MREAKRGKRCSLHRFIEACSLAATGDGRDEHDLVAILEGVGFAAEEADVLVVDVDVDEAPELALLVLDLAGKRGEVLVDVGDKRGEVCGFAGEELLAVGVADEGGGEDDLDGNRRAPLGSRWSIPCLSVDTWGTRFLVGQSAATRAGSSVLSSSAR